MRVLVTRAEPDGERLARDLRVHGIEALIEPLMTIRFVPEGARVLTPFLQDVQAVLFTSANGVRAFAAASDRRDIKAIAVGDATASAARAAGFAEIVSAAGTVEDLAALVIASLKPSNGPLIHAAGSVTAGDLAGLLEAAGFTLRRAVLYEAIPAERLSERTRTAFDRGEIDAALFFSPRNATTFVRLATGLERSCTRIVALALSRAVAAALQPLPWRRITIAGKPTEAALLHALEHSLAPERSA
jgi:uroporphyrinogen-III synthase